ncbi:MAG TPA: D-aminoacylase, partial [Polyangiaceae bacterium]|nr:D-aminoacylase [Polyangiaceae bacterium]
MLLKILFAFFLALTAARAEYDWLFRNARVVDGTGNPWFEADVAVEDGRIAAIGHMPNAEADHIIDASGLVLAPGFIDVHTHIEETILKVPLGDNFVFDGVTTVVTGNCGGSKVDLEAWFAELEKEGLGLNVASLIGHNSVRREVLGMENRQATPEELEKMRALVAKAM